jgi:metal-sulfur cluster biosynthetic enzyme
MASLFEFSGPAEAFEPVTRAMRWVVDPLTLRNLLDAGALRRVHMAEGRVQVRLCLAAGPTRQLIVEDAEAELFDHLEGRWQVEIVVVDPPPQRAAVRAAAR